VEVLIGALVTLGMYGGIFAYPVLQTVAVWRMHGRWRVLAIIPMAPMAIVLVLTVGGFFQGSSLWPILLVFTAPVALLYLCVVWFVHSRIHPVPPW
jgi:hypothetical protein